MLTGGTEANAPQVRRPVKRSRSRTTSKLEVSAGGSRRPEGALSSQDCLCPVCLEIFVEPVTLPCAHTFCKDCFQESVDKAALNCPICRKRISTWARQHSRNKTLVNQALWHQIQTRFPLQCQQRLSGQDTEDHYRVFLSPRVCQPGELRQEYEDEVNKMTEERRAREEEERRASEEFIQNLLREEEAQRQQELSRRSQEDEQLAILLSNQLNGPPAPQENCSPADTPPLKKKKKKEVSVGHIERFLNPRPQCSVLGNKENILLSAPHLPGPRPLCGVEQQQEEQQETPSRTPERSSLEGRSSGLEVAEEAEVFTKSACYLRAAFSSSSSSSSASPSSSFSFLEALQDTAELEEERQERQRQEKEDRMLALLLQKELDQEGRQRVTNRRKGSADAYMLRQAQKDLQEAQSSSTPSRPPVRSTKTSSSPHLAKTQKPSTSSSPSSSCCRRSKQTTLTEMFSSLNS